VTTTRLDAPTTTALTPLLLLLLLHATMMMLMTTMLRDISQPAQRVAGSATLLDSIARRDSTAPPRRAEPSRHTRQL